MHECVCVCVYVCVCVCVCVYVHIMGQFSQSCLSINFLHAFSLFFLFFFSDMERYLHDSHHGINCVHPVVSTSPTFLHISLVLHPHDGLCRSCCLWRHADPSLDLPQWWCLQSNCPGKTRNILDSGVCCQITSGRHA